ncbi:MAG: TonB family protein [Myxococcota bacterium]
MFLDVLGLVCLLAAPVVEAPELRESVEADYPPAALAERLTARVVLRLDIDATGMVTAAEVTEPVGHGFDEAARAAVLRFRFQPATRDGNPIASRILYTYLFELEPEPEPEPTPALATQPEPEPPAPEDVEEVEIRGARADREVTKREMTREQLRTAAGSNGDALRAIQNLPSIARAPGLAGQLVVRGSAPEDTEAYVDGSFVPFVYHFGGLASIIPTEMLDGIDFYPGNFGAKYGRVAGGIVDIRMRPGETDGGFHGMAQVDFIDARGLVRGPLGRGWTIIAGVRRSHLDAWIGGLLPSGSRAPYYFDAQLFLENRLTERSRLRIGVYGAYDALRVVDEGEGDAPVGTVAVSQGFYRIQANYDNQLTDALSLKLMASWGRDTPNFNVGPQRIASSLYTYALRGELQAKLADWMTVSAGYDVVTVDYATDLRFPDFALPGESDTGVDATARTRVLKTGGWFNRPAAYLQARITPIAGLEVVPSLRLDYDHENENLDFGPRMNARYDIRPTFPRTTIKGAAGLYYKPPVWRETLPVVGQPGLNSDRVLAKSLGVEQELARGVTLSFEGFHKELERLVSRTPTEDGGYLYGNRGSGRAYGTELLVRHEGERLSGFLAYTLSRSTRVDQPGEQRRLFEYDQTHILTALASYRLGSGWLIGGRFRMVSGNPYTPCVGGRFDSSSGSYACITGREYGERMPMFHQLDVRVEKTWAFTSWKLSTYVDVINAYNHKNAEAPTYKFDNSQGGFAYGLPFFPSIGVRGEL